jgi:sugar transferase (PEP-CTERM/EpsH1 system associated)
VPSRLNVLFLTQRLPYAPNRGDRVRAYHILKVLAGEADVTVASLVHDKAEAAESGRLEGLAKKTIVAPVSRWRGYLRAVAALPSSQPLTTALLDSSHLRRALRQLVSDRPPDVVLAYCSSMARFALESPLDRLPLVIDMVDADSAKWQALAGSASWPHRWVYKREARTLSGLEARAMRIAHATIAVNAREVDLLRELAPGERIETVQNGVDLSSFAPRDPPAASTRVVFCGVMNYEPNEMGARWIAREVWPLVRQKLPASELRIVGASPTQRVIALQSDAQGIVVTGSIADVRPELWAAAVAAAPLHTARGVQNKVLEAVAAGLPCVITSAVNAGLPAEITPACLIGDTPQAFAAALVSMLNRTPAERRAMASVDLAGLSWELKLQPLLSLLREAASTGRARTQIGKRPG